MSRLTEPRLFVPLLLSLLLASCQQGGPVVRIVETQAAIQSGTEDSGHPAVGVLAAGSSRCTATLVGKRTVLTAAHCINSIPPTFSLCPGSASCSNKAPATYPSSQAIQYPGWNGNNTNDVAVVILTKDVTEVSAMPINVDPLTVGQAITIVGFGQPGFGTKRMGFNTISVVGATNFKFANLPNVDNGDSGGPTLIEIGGQERVAGVHSTKGTGGGTDIRPDMFQDWLHDVSGGDLALPSGAAAPSGPAGEGKSCFSRACDAGLACVTVFANDAKTEEQGRFCMEICKTAGSDPACDGAESCVESKSAGPVCFAKDNAGTGFTNPDASSPPDPTAPQPSPPSDPPSDPAPAAPPASPPSEPTPPPSNPGTPAGPTTPAPSPTGPDSPDEPTPTEPDPRAPDAGAFGASCGGPEDCQNGLCAELSHGSDRRYCTQACAPTGDGCPQQAECLSADADSGSHFCAPPEQGQLAADDNALYGACSVGQNLRPDGSLILLLMIGAVWLRRSRRR